jgi:HTH-type transcriptional regulator, sugar sensing transcriptional regulator
MTPTEQVLHELGLSSGETKVYLALLKLGPSNVHQIKRATTLHRTTIYDFLEKLGNKGLVSDIIEQGTHRYTAAHPDKLFELLENKKENLKTVFNELVTLQKQEKQESTVEIFRGLEGFRRMGNEIIKTSKELLIFGIDEKEFEKKMSIEMKQVFRRQQEAGIHERIITFEGAFVYNKPNMEYRSIPKKYFSPTPTFIFGNTVCIDIWEPLMIIFIKNKQLAKSYKKHFELLWKIAKPMKSKYLYISPHSPNTHDSRDSKNNQEST